MFPKILKANNLLDTDSRTYFPIRNEPQKANFKDYGY